MRILALLPIAYCLLPLLASSQSNQNIPLYREKILQYEKYFNNKDCSIHTSIKPFINSKGVETMSDSIKRSMTRRTDTLPSKANTHDKDNILTISGIGSAEGGYERSTKNKSKFLLDGGLTLEGHFKNKLSLNSTFIAGNTSFPSYLDTFISSSHVIPGMGSAYSSKNGYSYQYYSGYLSYSPNRIFNFQAGKGKHFWGDGYRSLFLSDVSNSFPYLKITTTVWKFQYTNLFTWMKDVTTPSNLKSDFKDKFASFHYLSWNVSKRLNIGLFESVVWQGSDSNRTRSFDVNYLNPIIFYRPVEYSLGSSDNVLIGFSFKEKLFKKQQLYGQLLLDEFLLSAVKEDIKHSINSSSTGNWGWWGNKYGWQLGFKSFDLFKIDNLSFQTEVNVVRPFTYSHGSVQQNYANYNQPLAHPLGSNFEESVTFLNYRHKKWMFEAEFMYALCGKDSGGKNMGSNIFQPYITHQNEYGNYTGQGIKTNLRYMQLKCSYYLLPSSDLLAEAGIALRQESNSFSSTSSTFFFIGIKTGFMNRYADF